MKNYSPLTTGSSSVLRAMALLAVFCMAIFAQGCGVDHQVVGSHYVNKTHNVSLQIPTSGKWLMTTEGDGVKISNTNHPRLRMNFQAKPNPGTNDPSVFVTDFLKNDYKQFTAPGKTKKRSLQFKGLKAAVVEFADGEEFTPQQYMLVGIVKDGRGYVFTIACPIREFPQIKKDVMEIVASVKVGN